MASVSSNFCVGYGGPALPKNRRVVNEEVGLIWAGSLNSPLVTCVGGVIIIWCLSQDCGH